MATEWVTREGIEQTQAFGERPGKLGWVYLLGGSGLAVLGLTRRSVTGFALAATGGYLAFEGIQDLRRGGKVRSMPLHFEKTVTINRPVEEVYSFFRRLEDYPKFMTHLKSVEPLWTDRYRWNARGPFGFTMSWEGQIIDDLKNEAIVWSSVPNSGMQHTGQVRFRKAPGDRGTEVAIRLDYEPILGKAGTVLRSLFGFGPEQRLLEDMRRAKQLLEAGEIPTTIGQTSGRRGLRGIAQQFLYREQPLERRKRPA